MINSAAPRVVKPAARWYLVGVAVLVVGLAAGVWQFKRSVPDAGESSPLDHAGEIWIDRAGSFSVYITLGGSRRTDHIAEQAWEAARSAFVSVVRMRTGDRLPVKNVYEDVEMHNNKMARLVEFDVPAQGGYRVKIVPSLSQLKPVVRPSMPIDQVAEELLGLFHGAVAGIALGGLGVIAGIAILLTTFLRRRHDKQAAAAETSAAPL